MRAIIHKYTPVITLRKLILFLIACVSVTFVFLNSQTQNVLPTSWHEVFQKESKPWTDVKVEDLGFDYKFPQKVVQEENPAKKWNLCVCLMVHNEAPYMPEWIEFHRLQGIDHFVIYDFNNSDLILYLPMWYESAGVVDFIETYPARFVPEEERPKDGGIGDRALNRHYALWDCYMRHHKFAEWVITMDSSQFLYSPKDIPLRKVINSHAKSESEKRGADITAISVQSVTFGGPSDTAWEYESWLTPNSYTGSADYLYRPVTGTYDTYPLVMEMNPKREPFSELDGNFTEHPPCTAASGKTDPFCRKPHPVMILKSRRCVAENITLCVFAEPAEERFRQSTPEQKNIGWPSVLELRANHYPWRPLNRFHKPEEALVINGLNSRATVPGWFSSVADDFGSKYGKQISDRVMLLNPLVFIDVGRHCNENAVISSQQVKCPGSHPYPYGDKGVNYLRDCCKTDKDKAGLPLVDNSTTCENDASTPCVEPPARQKWLHRSCCINTG